MDLWISDASDQDISKDFFLVGDIGLTPRALDGVFTNCSLATDASPIAADRFVTVLLHAIK